MLLGSLVQMFADDFVYNVCMYFLYIFLPFNISDFSFSGLFTLPRIQARQQRITSLRS